MWQDSLAAWGLLVRPSSVASPPTFAYAFLYIKKGVTYETEAIREIEHRQSHNHRLWDQIDLGFLPRRRGSEAVFTANKPFQSFSPKKVLEEEPMGTAVLHQDY
jgi:hypothetical protein